MGIVYRRLLLLITFYFIRCNALSEKFLQNFRNLQFSINYHYEPIIERSALSDYEYVVQGVNKYMCSIELLKRYMEMGISLDSDSITPNIPNSSNRNMKSYDDLKTTLLQLKNKCSVAVPMHSHNYIYIVCFYKNIQRFQFIENSYEKIVNIGNFDKDQLWSFEQLNMENINMDSLTTTEGTHFQMYLNGEKCSSPVAKDLYYKTTIKFYCNPSLNVTKITNIIELAPCHIEIGIETNILCDFPMFNSRFHSKKETTKIDCYPMVDKKYKSVLGESSLLLNNPIENLSMSSSPSSSKPTYIIKGDTSNNLVLPLLGNLHNIIKSDLDVFKNTKFVTQLLPDGTEYVSTETKGKIKDSYFDTKIKINRLFNLANNQHMQSTIKNDAVIKNLESMNITNILENSLLQQNNHTTHKKLDSNNNNDDDIIDDDDDDDYDDDISKYNSLAFDNEKNDLLTQQDNDLTDSSSHMELSDMDKMIEND